MYLEALVHYFTLPTVKRVVLIGSRAHASTVATIMALYTMQLETNGYVLNTLLYCDWIIDYCLIPFRFHFYCIIETKYRVLLKYPFLFIFNSKTNLHFVPNIVFRKGPKSDGDYSRAPRRESRAL